MLLLLMLLAMASVRLLAWTIRRCEGWGVKLRSYGCELVLPVAVGIGKGLVIQPQATPV